MDRSSSIGGPHHNQFTPPESKPDAPYSNQTVTLTPGLRDSPAQDIPTKQLSERLVSIVESASYLDWLPPPLRDLAKAVSLISKSYDVARSTYRALTSDSSPPEPGESDPARKIATTSLSERSVAMTETVSYPSQRPALVKEIARAAASFSYDLVNTTYQTVMEGWPSLGQGVSEAAKLGVGTMGLAASLAQAGIAAAGEFADKHVITITDHRVDIIGWALAKAGIKTVGVPKSELRQLGMSLAWLHLGTQQDIHITQGKLELTSENGNSAGLKWARSYRPENTNAPSTRTQGETELTDDQTNSENPVIRISNIHLEGVQCEIEEPGESGKNKESLTIKAQRLAFEIEYAPSGSTEHSQDQPITFSIEIHKPELIGKSNLLSLVATAINRYCSGLLETLPGRPVSHTDQEPTTWNQLLETLTGRHVAHTDQEPPIWNQEETGVQLQSQTAHIKLKNIKSLSPDMSDYIPDEISLSLIDLNAGLQQSLIGDQASKPNIFFESLDFGDHQSGPFHIRAGLVKLDEDLNGSLEIMVQTPFSQLAEFMTQLPEFAQAFAKKRITGNQIGDNRLGILIGLDIASGEIDLNTLTAKGVREERLGFLQQQIEHAIVRALQSKHTRFRDLPTGNKEFKLDTLAISGKTTRLINRKLHGITSKKTSGYYDLGEIPYIKTESNSRGKISLAELLQIDPGSDSPPTQPS